MLIATPVTSITLLLPKDKKHILKFRDIKNEFSILKKMTQIWVIKNI